MRHDHQKTSLRRRSRRPLAGTNQAAGTAAHRSRSARAGISLEGTGSNERHLGPTTEASPQIHKVNVPYQPLRGPMCLPLDCWDLLDFDFAPLPAGPWQTQNPVNERNGDVSTVTDHHFRSLTS